MDKVKKELSDSLMLCVNTECEFCPQRDKGIKDKAECRKDTMLNAAFLLRDPWFDADDDKPENDELVLVFIRPDEDFRGRVRLARWDGDKWHILGSGAVCDPVLWMPTPNVPEWAMEREDD